MFLCFCAIFAVCSIVPLFQAIFAYLGAVIFSVDNFYFALAESRRPTTNFLFHHVKNAYKVQNRKTCLEQWNNGTFL